MKQIVNYINEKLHVTTKSHAYSCHPKDKWELRDIIIQRIKEDGPECDLNDIDVSDIDEMLWLFNANPKHPRHRPGNEIFKDFNGDISQWDVSNVVNMSWMFYDCEKFNSDISQWDVSNVVNMESMFYRCTNFNQDIRSWNVSNVGLMNLMFYKCEKFNQNLDRWNVSNVKEMYNAFYNCPAQPKWYDRNKWEDER